ncbi:MAG TPA: hypothetical protein VL051_04675 [Burkholderiaceae bacterium]|nr:hypothetical protein [Burkholderiaceae bacterium]
MGSRRYFIGFSPQRHTGGLARIGGADPRGARDSYPSRDVLELALAPLRRQFGDHPQVREFHAASALGKYGTSQEIALSVDLAGLRGFDPTALVRCVFSLAVEHRQIDAFVGRLLEGEEWTDNARPTLVLMLKTPQRLNQLSPLLEQINRFEYPGLPIDGFTTIPAAELGIGWAAGLRYVFLPEISMRWNPEMRRLALQEPARIEELLIDQAMKIGKLCQHLHGLPEIALAALRWCDVVVGGIEDYAVFRHASAPAPSPHDTEFPLLSTRYALSTERAMQRRARLLAIAETAGTSA